MKVYAHWLEGDYRKALTGVTVQRPWSVEDEKAERLIKTLALFGASIVLSDVQVVDSPVVWRLFSQNGFLRFLRNNPDFMELKATPVSRGHDLRWNIATAGLERALKVGHIGSPMHNSNAVICLAGEIITAGPVGDFDFLLARRRGSPDFDALSGFVAAVRYFASPGSRVAEPLPTSPQHTFYSVIEVALRNPELTGSHLQKVESTIQLVDQLVENPADRIRRAMTYKHLDWSKPGHFDAWRIIVQAWNVAAQRTVCGSGGSIGNMPHSVPIGAYVDQTADIMFSGVEEDTPKSRSLHALVPELRLDWDPGDLTWAEIDQIIGNERAGEARSSLQKSLMIPGEKHVEAAVIEFAETIAPLVKNKLKRPEGWWFWALGNVLIRFGGPAVIPMLTVALFAGQAGERGMFWAVRRFGERMMAARILEAANKIGIPPAKTG